MAKKASSTSKVTRKGKGTEKRDIGTHKKSWQPTTDKTTTPPPKKKGNNK